MRCVDWAKRKNTAFSDVRWRRVAPVAVEPGDMDNILRFNGGAKRAPAIDAWLNERSVEHRPIVRKWFERMRRCGPDVRELLHDGHPTVCVGDVAFAYVNAFKDHVNVGFFNAVELDDPAGLLEGTGKRMRHVKLKPGRALNAAALADLIRAAYVDGKVRAARTR